MSDAPKPMSGRPPVSARIAILAKMWNHTAARLDSKGLQSAEGAQRIACVLALMAEVELEREQETP